MEEQVLFRIFYGDLFLDVFIVAAQIFLTYIIGIRKYGKYIYGYSIFDGGVKKFLFHLNIFVVVGLAIRISIVIFVKLSVVFLAILAIGAVILYIFGRPYRSGKSGKWKDTAADLRMKEIYQTTRAEHRKYRQEMGIHNDDF